MKCLIREFVGSSNAFHLALIAGTLEHQVGDAPDGDLQDNTGGLSANIYYDYVPPYGTAHTQCSIGGFGV